MDEEFVKLVAMDVLKNRGLEDSAIWKGLAGIGLHLLLNGMKQKALDEIAAEKLVVQERMRTRLLYPFGQPLKLPKSWH